MSHQRARWASFREGFRTLALLLFLVSPLSASPEQHRSEPPTEIEALRRRVREQEQTIEQLKQQLAEQRRLLEELRREVRALARRSEPSPDISNRPSERAASPGERASPLLLWSNGRPTLRSADGDFELSFSGEGQLDFRAYERGSVAPPNTFLVRRLRLAVSGRMLARYEYKIQADFAERGTGLLRDGWLRVRVHPGLYVQAGHFKEPFSQEELRSAMHIDFVERAMATRIAPSRSPGVQLAGEVARGRIAYQLGAFNGKGSLAPNTTRTPEGVLRVRLSPWRGPEGQGVSFGGAFALGRQRGGMSLIGQTESQSATFFSARSVNGQVLRANGELTYLAGPFALRAEYNQMAQDRYQLGPNRTTLPAVVAKGYTAQATYLLTGEKKPENGPVIPHRSFPLAGAGGRGWGAWEAKLRYSVLRLSDGMESARAETITCGVNWYLTPFVKYMFDLAVERFPTSPFGRPERSISVLTRLQFAF